jgi:Predicted Zn-dependent protease (DUF2268)
MSLETRARAAAKQAQRGLATVVVPDPARVVRRARRRRQARLSVTIATAIVGVAALVVPLATWIDRDGAPSVVGAPTGTAQPRAGKAFVIAIEPEAIEAADAVGVNLTRLTRTSLARVGQLLPGLEKVVRVEVDPLQVIPEIGLRGTTDTASGDVFVYLDPDRVNRDLLRVWVPALLAREAHNSARIRQGPGFGTTLGDWIVTEGLADAFAREAFPATPLAPWVEALSDEEQGLYWALAQPFLNQTPPDREAADELFNEWFFGTGAIPRWAGYNLGFELVTAFLSDHPDTTAATLVDTPGERIISESGYDPAPPDPNRPRCYTNIAQTRETPCAEYEAMFIASGLVAEPSKCYVIGQFAFVAEARCLP